MTSLKVQQRLSHAMPAAVSAARIQKFTITPSRKRDEHQTKLLLWNLDLASLQASAGLVDIVILPSPQIFNSDLELRCDQFRVTKGQADGCGGGQGIPFAAKTLPSRPKPS